MSDPSYTTIISEQANQYISIAGDIKFCNFIPVSNLVDFEDAHYVKDNIRTIFFYPKWKYEEFHKHPNATIAEAFRKGYEVVYDLDNTIEIYHWNRFSNQTITIDPHNIIVPDEMRDLHGFELEMYSPEHMSKSMTFDTYLLEQICSKINATAVVTDHFTKRILIMPLISMRNSYISGLVPGAGTIYWAVKVPRAKPKSIVSILIDPFDMYTWITYFILVLTMAITIALFGELLGRHRFVEIVLELIMITLAGPSRAYGGSFENRIITVFCFMGIVLVSSYQSLVISFMSFARYHPEINTLAEIQERCLFRDGRDAQFFNFKTYPNGTFAGVGEGCGFEYARDNEERTIMIASQLKYDRFAHTAQDYMRYKVHNYHHAKTKFFEYQLHYIVNARLYNIFMFYSRAIFESGIYDHYYNNKSLSNWHYVQDTFVDRVVKVGDLTLLWYAYACGNLLSVVYFVIERIVHNEFEGLSVKK
ncbi:uncharacterized protein LOC128300291 [Anopheles moucheti]|uniref:uncharacterized protein LOC128300291 n=1 Tax=Anopheles moucheti TaxID=186751 RepID=UPI0022F0A5AB|nr:uncharacterized protein LOC128300291 [Anopheles moucheti]